MSFIRNLKRHLKTLLCLPLPDRLLKHFPPNFTLRDPVLSLVHRSRTQGNRCALLLLKLEGALPMVETYPAEWLNELHRHVRHAMVAALPLFFRPTDVIGVKQSNEDYFLFIRANERLDYDVIHHMSQQLRAELERRIQAKLGMAWSGHIRFLAGCSFLSPDITDTPTAVHSAYQYASSVAHRRLPADFSANHLHLIDIIREENVRVLAQPIMDLHSGEVSGWEFLTRGPQNTPFHDPEDLFDFAHQAELLPKLELIVCKKAFQEIARRDIRETVFLNITAVSLGNRAFLDRLMETLKAFERIDPRQIVFEITERYRVADYGRMAETLREYRSFGFRFAVDDAGTGFSSLQSISELIPDMIKIDRSVIQNIDRVSVKQVMLRTLLYMAEHINCQVIAEGVERQEEAHVLFKHQVRMGQGFYFAKPAPYFCDHQRSHLQQVKEKIMTERQLSSA